MRTMGGNLTVTPNIAITQGRGCDLKLSGIALGICAILTTTSTCPVTAGELNWGRAAVFLPFGITIVVQFQDRFFSARAFLSTISNVRLFNGRLSVFRLPLSPRAPLGDFLVVRIRTAEYLISATTFVRVAVVGVPTTP